MLRGKYLDLLLLAGCSCLITLLHHPVAEALTLFENGHLRLNSNLPPMSPVAAMSQPGDAAKQCLEGWFVTKRSLAELSLEDWEKNL